LPPSNSNDGISADGGATDGGATTGDGVTFGASAALAVSPGRLGFGWFFRLRFFRFLGFLRRLFLHHLDADLLQLLAQQSLPRRKYSATITTNAWRANEIIRFTFDELRFFRAWLCAAFY